MSARNHSPPPPTLTLRTVYRTNCPRPTRKLTSIFVLSAYRYRPYWRNDTISEYYADDFRDFTVDDFKIINPDSRRELGSLLRNRGVYVPKEMNVLMADRLFAVVQEDNPWLKLEDADFKEGAPKTLPQQPFPPPITRLVIWRYRQQ